METTLIMLVVLYILIGAVKNILAISMYWKTLVHMEKQLDKMNDSNN